jgi:hypothetical protein
VAKYRSRSSERIKEQPDRVRTQDHAFGEPRPQVLPRHSQVSRTQFRYCTSEDVPEVQEDWIPFMTTLQSDAVQTINVFGCPALSNGACGRHTIPELSPRRTTRMSYFVVRKRLIGFVPQFLTERHKFREQNQALVSRPITTWSTRKRHKPRLFILSHREYRISD